MQPCAAPSRTGLTIVELLVTVSIIGIFAAVGFVLIPRQGTTVVQAQRIATAGVQFARFEAIKRNEPVTASVVVGSSQIDIQRVSDGSILRSFVMDPQSRSVVVKSVSPNGAITFNARGVATTPVSRTATIGIAGRDDVDVALTISGQGTVTEAP